MASQQLDHFSADQLATWRRLQAQVYGVLADVADTLRAGDSERTVARRLHRALKAIGAQSYFHVPVALFGDRTAYPGNFGQLEALPTDRMLADGDAVILDAAPLLQGYIVDCSYAAPRPGVELGEFDELLRQLRALILERAKARANMREVAREVDQRIRDAGFENCHRKHIGKVLGHRATYTPHPRLARRRVWGLSPLPAWYFLVSSLRASRGRPELTPNWNHTRQSDTPMQPGLWAVEPHLGRGAVGAKFEELLVVTADDAWWLADSAADGVLPHHQRWERLAATPH